MEQRKIIDRNIKEDNYLLIKQMEEHAKKYDFTFDKKEFLKNVSASEQKIILLNSKNPYEVLKYLEEIDLQSTKLVLNQLNYDEIKKILFLFSSEDKKQFYTNFSDLSLVNQFIMYDKNYYNYIKDLTFDRKIELLESLNKETVEASSRIYENMSPVEQEKASEAIENPITSLALNEHIVDSSSIDTSYMEDSENILDNLGKEKTNEEILEVKEDELEEEQTQDNPKEENEEKNKDSVLLKEETNQNLIQEEPLKNVELFEESANLCEKRDIEKITNELQNIELLEVGKTI